MPALLYCSEEEALGAEIKTPTTLVNSKHHEVKPELAMKCHIQRDLYEVTSSYGHFQQFTTVSVQKCQYSKHDS